MTTWEECELAVEADRVAIEDRVLTHDALLVCLEFSNDARRKAMAAEEALLRAVRRAEEARDYMSRTTETLEQASWLFAVARGK